MATKKIKINRAPVMTLWAAVVAERLGYDHETALTLGKGVAGLNAQAKGKSLGIFEEPMEALAKAYAPKRLAAEAYDLYEQFRPKIPEGKKGWGAKGDLDLGYLRDLADKAE